MYSTTHEEAEDIVDKCESTYYVCKCIHLNYRNYRLNDENNSNGECEIHIFPNIKLYGSSIYKTVLRTSWKVFTRKNFDYGEDTDHRGRPYIWYHVQVAALSEKLTQLNTLLAEISPKPLNESEMSTEEIYTEIETLARYGKVCAKIIDLVGELRKRNLEHEEPFGI